ADKIDERWTIRGLARELGVEWGWVYNRIRNGLLREPDVSRKPPYGNILIRDDAELLARLRAEDNRSRRLRREAATGSIPPGLGESPGRPVEVESRVANRVMTSRTNSILHAAKSDSYGGDDGSLSGTPTKTGGRAVSCWG